MSSSLCWEPIKPKNHKTFGTSLKLWLRADGDLVDAIYCKEDLTYFRGAMAAATGDLKIEIGELLEAIEKHGEIHVWEQY